MTSKTVYGSGKPLERTKPKRLVWRVVQFPSHRPQWRFSDYGYFTEQLEMVAMLYNLHEGEKRNSWLR